jgi:hypothetical protein
VNKVYMEQPEPRIKVMGRVFAWSYFSARVSLLHTSQYVAPLERRQWLRIACPEEIAYRLVYVPRDQFDQLARRTSERGWGGYLISGCHRGTGWWLLLRLLRPDEALAWFNALANACDRGHWLDRGAQPIVASCHCQLSTPHP